MHNKLRVYTIKLSNMNGGNNTWSGSNAMLMNLGKWGINSGVILHEVGHQIGLADTYYWINHEPVGQPDAIMNNLWSLNGKLQKDDIDGIRFVWKVLNKKNNGKVCPLGYKKGEYRGKLIWGENYCVIDPNADPDDQDIGNNNTLTDKNQYCADWARRGECTRNPNYMLPNCALSCSQVTNNNNNNLVDKNQFCSSWATRGECTRNPNYMLPNCALSCSQVKTNNTVLTISKITSRGGKGQWGEGKLKAFDRKINTKWLDESRSTWIKVKYNRGFTLSSYKLTSANDVISRDPKNWKLMGSNNGQNWVELDRRNNITFSRRHQTKNFTVNSNQSFNEYYLVITSNHGNKMTQIAEIDFID